MLKFEADQNLQKLRQPVDKDKWSTEPAVVNAFYNPNKNDIGKLDKTLSRNEKLKIVICSFPGGYTSTIILQSAFSQVAKLRRNWCRYRT